MPVVRQIRCFLGAQLEPVGLGCDEQRPWVHLHQVRGGGETVMTSDRIIRTLAAASNIAVAAALVYFTRWITKKGF